MMVVVVVVVLEVGQKSSRLGLCSLSLPHQLRIPRSLHGNKGIYFARGGLASLMLFEKHIL